MLYKTVTSHVSGPMKTETTSAFGDLRSSSGGYKEEHLLGYNAV
jgi:hypothetical protein